MGQVLSLVVDVRNVSSVSDLLYVTRKSHSQELGLSLQQTYQTKFQAITTLKVQPGGHLLLAGSMSSAKSCFKTILSLFQMKLGPSYYSTHR